MILSHHNQSQSTLEHQNAIVTEETATSFNHAELGASRLSVVGKVAFAGLAVMGGLYLKNSVQSGIDSVFGLKDKIITEGETTVKPPHVTKAEWDMKHEITSYSGTVKGEVVETIRDRGIVGWGANVTCETPFETSFHGSPDGEISGTITDDNGKITAHFKVPSKIQYSEKTFMSDENPNGAHANCKEGGLAAAVDVMGGHTTDPIPKSKAAFKRVIKGLLTPYMPYSDIEGQRLAECGTAGSVAGQAKTFNVDRGLKKKGVTVTIGKNVGTYNYNRCVTNGSPQEAVAWQTGATPTQYIRIHKPITVNA